MDTYSKLLIELIVDSYLTDRNTITWLVWTANNNPLLDNSSCVCFSRERISSELILFLISCVKTLFCYFHNMVHQQHFLLCFFLGYSTSILQQLIIIIIIILSYSDHWVGNLFLLPYWLSKLLLCPNSSAVFSISVTIPNSSAAFSAFLSLWHLEVLLLLLPWIILF